MASRRVLSQVLGLIYFTAWSASFWPQPLLNIRRKSVAGVAIEFPILNLFGFLMYSVYTACFLFSPVIKYEYALRHPRNPTSTVTWWDFAFTAHALIMINVFLFQYWWYRDNDKYDTKGRKPGKFIVGISFASLSAVIVVVCLALATETGYAAPGNLQWLDVLYVMSNLKLVLTIIKYIPQVILNYRRKSTSGWTISTILLDFVGGISSMSQLIVDSSMSEHAWTEGVTGNSVKFFLGVYSVFFDLIFIWQHYIQYGYLKTRREQAQKQKQKRDGDERQPLIEESDQMRAQGVAHDART